VTGLRHPRGAAGKPAAGQPAAPAPRAVILCGFMGTGKTLTGRALAALLSVPFLDVDEMVETREGASVADIFARDGEARFRELEAGAIASIADSPVPAPGAVVATGGGALLREDNFARLAALGTMVVLDASLSSIVARTAAVPTRPRLPRTAAGAVDEAAVRALYDSRRAGYDRVAWHIDTTARTPDETAFEIAETLRHGERVIHLRVDTRPIPSHTPRPGESRLTRIVSGPGVFDTLGTWIREVGIPGDAFVLSSRRVATHHGVRARAALDAAGVRGRFIEIDDTETGKRLDQAERLLYELSDAGARRDSAVVALGGGVTGDLAGFVAATYMRGIPFVQVPTTLLAQVDAAIGGKVGVNHPRAKNLIGAIHHPHLVVSDPATLATLPSRQLASGMAEVVKTAIIGSGALFEELRAAGAARAGEAPLFADVALLQKCVAVCARVKVGIVERDPYEHDARRLLNLGHTFGHAIEAAAGYGTLTHGEAVALGLLAAIRVAVGRGMATGDFYEATRSIIAACSLPTRIPPVESEPLLHAMGRDKKRRSAGLSFVLPVAPGDVRVVDGVSENEIIAAAPRDGEKG
jgi:3-dehydroquinate synthase